MLFMSKIAFYTDTNFVLHKILVMKNVTVTLEEPVAHWARVWAAEHDTSLSRMLGQMLRDRMNENREYERAMEEFLQTQPQLQALRNPGESLPSRDAIHERD